MFRIYTTFIFIYFIVWSNVIIIWPGDEKLVTYFVRHDESHSPVSCCVIFVTEHYKELFIKVIMLFEMCSLLGCHFYQLNTRYTFVIYFHFQCRQSLSTMHRQYNG